MIVSLKSILQYASAKNIAIGAFNITELEGIQAVLEVAEEKDQPVILQFAPVHEEYIGLDVIGPVMVLMAEKSKVPVCVHLDHCDQFSQMKYVLELGFSSIMYDGSMLPYEENVANTKIAVELAKQYGASVEAELGVMNDESGDEIKSCYTDPAEAEQFVKETGIDALACSFGTVHGLYKAKPKLDFERIEEIANRTGVPIVMHGGSGIEDEDVKLCIEKGVRKINYYTYRAKFGGEYVREKCRKQQGDIYFHNIMCWGRESMKVDVEKAISVFSGE